MTRLQRYICATAGLVALATSPALVASDQGFFTQETLSGKHARVKTSHDLPQRTWNQACRSTLLEPLRQQQVRQLEALIDSKLDGYGAFVSASIEGYQSHRSDSWLHCQADSIEINESASLAGTALREAWHGKEHYDGAVLRTLLQVALQSPTTYDDAIVLIATTTAATNQLQFLADNLEPSQLRLPAAIESVFHIWLEHSQFNLVLQYQQSCDTVQCRQLIVDAKHLKEKDDAEKVYDLSSYF